MHTQIIKIMVANRFDQPPVELVGHAAAVADLANSVSGGLPERFLVRPFWRFDSVGDLTGHEKERGTEIRGIEFMWNRPIQGTEFAPFLDGGIEESENVNQRTPFGRPDGVDHLLCN
jgi:hypothetical protein